MLILAVVAIIGLAVLVPIMHRSMTAGESLAAAPRRKAENGPEKAGEQDASRAAKPR